MIVKTSRVWFSNLPLYDAVLPADEDAVVAGVADIQLSVSFKDRPWHVELRLRAVGHAHACQNGFQAQIRMQYD